MARSVLLPISAIRPLQDESLRLLNETTVHASAMLSIFARLPAEGTGRIMDAASAYMRRWSVEIVLVVGEKGPISFGALSRALGGLPSGSLTPRLRELEARGVLARTPAGDAQGRVLYELTPQAEPLAATAYALTLGKAYHHACVRGASWAPRLPVLETLARVRADPKALADHSKRYIKAATAFRAHHSAVSVEGEFEEALETARRYCVACTRKWHAGVLWTLSTMGPHTFGQLKRRTGAGDEALSTALGGLMELENIARDGQGVSRKYQMSPFGVFDMSLGMGSVFVYDDIRSKIEGRSSLVTYTR